MSEDLSSKVQSVWPFPTVDSIKLDEIFTTVQNIIHDYTGKAKEKITLETTLSNLDLDSLDQVDIWIEVEDEFDISISDEDADKLSTVKDIIDCVQKNLMERISHAPVR